MPFFSDPQPTRREALGPLLMALASIAALFLIDYAIERSLCNEAHRWNTEVHHGLR